MRALALAAALLFTTPALAETVEIGGMGVVVDVPDTWTEKSTDDDSQYFVSPEKTSEIRFFAVEGGGGGLISKMLTMQMKQEDSDNKLDGPEKRKANGLKFKRWTGSKPSSGRTMNFSLARVKVPGMGTILVVLRSLDGEGEDALDAILESMRDTI